MRSWVQRCRKCDVRAQRVIPTARGMRREHLRSTLSHVSDGTGISGRQSRCHDNLFTRPSAVRRWLRRHSFIIMPVCLWHMHFHRAEWLPALPTRQISCSTKQRQLHRLRGRQIRRRCGQRQSIGLCCLCGGHIPCNLRRAVSVRLHQLRCRQIRNKRRQRRSIGLHRL